jgi:Skp family chaperone for outer membrane proteins
MRCLVLLAASACLAAQCGCGSNPPRSTAGKVAVLDLDEIAKRLGRDVAMTQSIREKEAALNGEINARAAAIERQLNEKRKQLGPQPNEEQKRELPALEAQARQQVQALRTQAAGKLNEHRLSVIRQFREEVKIAAQRIAARQGIDLMLTRNDTVVFSYQPVIDITDEIVAVMLVGNSVSAAPPARLSSEIAQR